MLKRQTQVTADARRRNSRTKGHQIMKTRTALAIVALFAIAAVAARAATWTNTGTGDWMTATNWSPNAVPTAGDAADILNGGTAVVSAPGAVANSMNISATGGTSRLVVNSGGDLTVNSITLAFNAGQNGAVEVHGGTLTVNSGADWTRSGNGTIIMTDGAINNIWTGNLYGPPHYAGSTWVYNQSGGAWTSQMRWNGSFETREFTLSDGTFTHTGSHFDMLSAGTSTVNINGGSMLIHTANYDPGVANNGATSNVSISQTDGLFQVGTAAGRRSLSLGPAGTAVYTISGGTLDVTNHLNIYAGDTFAVEGSGATISVYGNMDADSGSPTISFTAVDASGVSTIGVGGTLFANNSDLVVDLTDMTPHGQDLWVGSLPLFNTGGINGTFGTITPTGFIYDSTSTSGGVFSLEGVYVIPEPASAALLALAALCVVRRRR
jgi:hypothetical protein